MRNPFKNFFTRRWVRFTSAGLAGAVVVGAIVFWIMYPSPPDVDKVDASESLAFIGSDEYNKMFEWHRKQFALAVVDKLRDKSFDELIQMMMNGGRDPKMRKVGENVRKLEDHDDIGDAVFSMLLDKFYEQPEGKRQVYLMMAVRMEQGAAGRNPERFNIPSPDRFKKDLGRFMTRQSPQVQGKTARLIGDVRKQRKTMGLPDPW